MQLAASLTSQTCALAILIHTTTSIVPQSAMALMDAWHNQTSLQERQKVAMHASLVARQRPATLAGAAVAGAAVTEAAPLLTAGNSQPCSRHRWRPSPSS